MKMDNWYLFGVFLLLPLAVFVFTRCTYNETTVNNYYYPIVENNLTPENREFVRLLNEYRISKGLNPLIPEVLACQVCEIRNLQDIENQVPASHNGWSEMITDAQVNIDNGDHIYANEYVSPYELLHGYLASPDHKAALENPNRTHIGTSYINRRNHTIIVKY